MSWEKGEHLAEVPRLDRWVSSRGRVFKRIKNELREVRRSLATSGYLTVSIRRDGVSRNEYVHRLVLMAFEGKPAKGQVCRHLNGDPLDNRLENLKWGSRAENTADSIRHGTHNMAEGARHAMAKLSAGEVRQIRWRVGVLGESQGAVAEEFDIDQSQVSNIMLRKNWSHI
jgi:hypothetical protein